jgi:prephenate dehydrogenase
MFFDTIAIIGVGLLGGSIGLAVRERHLAKRVVGIGRDLARLREAENRRAVTEVASDLTAGVRDANLVIICTPVETVVDFVRQIAPIVDKGTLITDVGSTKATIVAGADKVLADGKGLWASFVGSHPLAGSEKNGILFAKATLFEGRTVVVTPSELTNADATGKIERFWQAVGAKTLQMTPGEHDAAVASASHLPHLIASALAAATPEVALPLTATGWGDTTRVAAGDVELWRQILLDNRLHTLKALKGFEKVLSDFRAALEANDSAALLRLLTQGKRNRDFVGN